MAPPMAGVERQHVGGAPRVAVAGDLVEPEYPLALSHVYVHQVCGSVKRQ